MQTDVDSTQPQFEKSTYETTTPTHAYKQIVKIILFFFCAGNLYKSAVLYDEHFIKIYKNKNETESRGEEINMYVKQKLQARKN